MPSQPPLSRKSIVNFPETAHAADATTLSGAYRIVIVACACGEVHIFCLTCGAWKLWRRSVLYTLNSNSTLLGLYVEGSG